MNDRGHGTDPANAHSMHAAGGPDGTAPEGAASAAPHADAGGTRRSLSRRELLRRSGFVVGAGLAASAIRLPFPAGPFSASPFAAFAQGTPAVDPSVRVAADPLDLPAPIRRSAPMHHDITLETHEVTAEIEPGVTFSYMTFGGRIPGPMIRVRQGDTVALTLKHGSGVMPHNIDLHAVYGPGGGADATMVNVGESKTIRFQARYPGAFIYHCAVAGVLDFHISSGMFGMIVVEPEEGLPPVDREYYLGQHELYTDKPTGEKGQHTFSFDAMTAEDPTYVLLNGEKYGLTAGARGAMPAKVGETARIFFVNGGPNLTSSFHPIGNVFTRVWREGGLLNTPERYLQTVQVAPGSTAVAELEFPVPGDVKLVDHALSRVARKGMLGVIAVDGPEQPEVFDPNPA